MEKIVAVDEALEGLKEVLVSRGYQVIGMEEVDTDRAHALVISGLDQNIMGMQDIKTKVPVISAEGKTWDEIVKNIDDYFQTIH